MAKKRLFDLPQQKTEFQMRGIVTGVEKKNFFTNKKTKSGVDMNMLNFGIEFDDKQTAYLTLNGMERDSVYFYNSKDKKTINVKWADRNKSQAEGYRMIGVNLGLERDEEDEGNIKYTMTEYDAAKYASQHLKDEMSVFVKGSVEFDSYTNDKGETKRTTKLIPSQISLCSKPVNFEEEDYEVLADFKTNLVFDSIEQEKDEAGKPTGRFIVNALSVGYATITNTEFIVLNAELASKLKKNMKPNWAIEATGVFASTVLTETVESDEDEWGEKSSFDRVSAPRKFEMIITGCKPSTIDKESYSENAIAEARKAIANKDKAEKSFGESKKDDDKAPWGDNDDSLEDDWS